MLSPILTYDGSECSLSSEASSTLHREVDVVTRTADLETHDLEDEERALLRLSDASVHPAVVETAPLSYGSAARQIIELAIPLSLSRVGMAIQGIANGMVIRRFSHDEIAAFPLATALVTEVKFSIYGVLVPTADFVGHCNGAQEYARIGEVVAQSGWTGLLLGIPSALLLRHISSVLNAMGIAEEVVHPAQAYCTALSYGVVPTCWFASDMLYAQGSGQKWVVWRAEIISAGVSMLLSYPLALGALGLPRLGLAGLGYGASLAAWLNFIGLRLYYKFSGQHDHFKLFDWHAPKIHEIKKFFEFGWSLGLNNAISGAHEVLLSLFAGKLGKEVLIAKEASFIPISAFNMVMSGLTLATRTEISNSMGALTAAMTCSAHSPQERMQQIEHLQQNVKRFGHTGIIIGLSTALAACIVFMSLSKQITETFIDTSHDISEETQQLARTLLSIQGVGLMIDAVRNISASNISASSMQGLQDILFASLLNAIAAFIGLTGAYASLQTNQDAEWLFIAQLLGNLVAAVGIIHRWNQKSAVSENKNILHRLA